ncbi:hypothetical protein [Stenotrophomonas sp. G106K1]|jgi:hypothetical protein|uniref:hypothetical protein n=1 Tax=Stenotrophomonas sp. G106K1 TaxID=3134792 RepID=UPI0030F4967C
MAAPSRKRCAGQARNRKAHSANPKHRRKVGTIACVQTDGAARSAGKVMDPATGAEYSVDIGIDGGVQITSGATGRRWTAAWDELIDLAIAAGIDRGAD